MLELFYSAVCTDFSKILILVLLYLVIFVLLFSAYGCWKIGILRLKELIFSFLLSAFLADGISYFIVVLAAGEMLLIWPFVGLFAVQAVVGNGAVYYRQ